MEKAMEESAVMNPIEYELIPLWFYCLSIVHKLVLLIMIEMGRAFPYERAATIDILSSDFLLSILCVSVLLLKLRARTKVYTLIAGVVNFILTYVHAELLVERLSI